MTDAGAAPPPAWLAAAAGAFLFAVLALAERRWALRRRVEGSGVRLARNLGSGVLALAVSTALQIAIGAPAAAWARSHGLGLLPGLGLPSALDTVLGVLLLDWTLWLWHLLDHRVPFFWRFHLVHHVDLDLDASTGLRFHAGEMALAVFYRVLQVGLLGVAPRSLLALWQAALFAAVLFHHSNLRLPVGLERVLVLAVVTPRMHGIHHSIVRSEANRNFASLLSVWDRLHGTLRLDVPQAEVTIGIPRFRTARDVSMARVMAIPFGRRGDDDWRLPDGTTPTRATGPDPRRLAG